MTDNHESPALPRRNLWLFLLLVAVLATRLPFLLHTLEEFDSANFAASLIEFSIPHNGPHPPGQYYYVMLLQGLNWLVHDELTTLSLASALFSSLAMVPYFFAVRLVFAGNERLAFGATALTAFSYGFWLVGLRPISDPVGCFFVYSTVCALLYGVERPRWFCAGMALFACTLGVKQLSLYFLAPLVIAVNVIVLWKGGWKACGVGAILFAAFFLGWLLPSLHSSGSLQNYLAACHKSQQWGYLYESVITHRSWGRVGWQAKRNFLAAWGSPVLAAEILALALAGMLAAKKYGLPAVLFLLFGLSTIIYNFLILFTFNKYYMYFVPVYCAFAMLGLHALATRLLADKPLLARAAQVLVFAALLNGGLLLALPLLVQAPGFRSPLQSITDLLAARKLPMQDVGILTDNGIVENELKYLQLQTPFDYSNTYFPRVITRLLDTKKQVFVITGINNFDLNSGLTLVATFQWNPALFDIFEGREEVRQLSLYQVDGDIQREYRLTGPQASATFFVQGVYGDGWATKQVSIILPQDSAPAPILHLQGVAPTVPGLTYPYKVQCQAVGGEATEFAVAKPGPFDLLVPLKRAGQHKDVQLKMTFPQVFVPARVDPANGDQREMTLQFSHFEESSAANPIFSRFGTGWYEKEFSAGTPDWWRWSGGEGQVEVASERAGTLRIDGQFSLLTSCNALDVLVDGTVAATVTAPVTGWSGQTVRVPLSEGLHQVVFRSQQPGTHPPNDGRVLAMGVRNLSFALE